MVLWGARPAAALCTEGLAVKEWAGRDGLPAVLGWALLGQHREMAGGEYRASTHSAISTWIVSRNTVFSFSPSQSHTVITQAQPSLFSCSTATWTTAPFRLEKLSEPNPGPPLSITSLQLPKPKETNENKTQEYLWRQWAEGCLQPLLPIFFLSFLVCSTLHPLAAAHQSQAAACSSHPRDTVTGAESFFPVPWDDLAAKTQTDNSRVQSLEVIL